MGRKEDTIEAVQVHATREKGEKVNLVILDIGRMGVVSIL